ncbi:MAG TPA: thioesterase family protein [Gemmatimonadaceae bacterium]|nr:thioesterase family protein [Gemmatimonadaceae bacterium]
MPTTTTELRVRYAETDQMQVVYHSNYLIWCEVGRTDFMRQHGMSYSEMEKGGIGLTVCDFSVRLHASARYDDLVRVATTLTDVRSRQVTFEYLLTNADTGGRLATARTMLISIQPDGRPVAMPADVRARLIAVSG